MARQLDTPQRTYRYPTTLWMLFSQTRRTTARSCTATCPTSSTYGSRGPLDQAYPDYFVHPMVPKTQEIVATPTSLGPLGESKDSGFFESHMRKALEEARRVVTPSSVSVIVFAHKSTSAWEAMLSALLRAGWTVTASWPIDTEMGHRVNAAGTASLSSSIHIVCRPREHPDRSLGADDIGDWRGVLSELPERIHSWMPRLAKEGIVGADAIFFLSRTGRRNFLSVLVGRKAQRGEGNSQ